MSNRQSHAESRALPTVESGASFGTSVTTDTTGRFSSDELAEAVSRVAHVWGKTDQTGKTDAVLALTGHLLDTYGVAGWLWDNWVPDQTKNVVMRDVKVGEHEARALFCFLAGVHDIGKATPAFASKVSELFRVNRDDGLEECPEEKTRGRINHHSRTGHSAVLAELTARGANRRLAQTWAIIVGSHHGDPPTIDEVGHESFRGSALGGSGWEAVRAVIFEHLWSETRMGDLIDRRGWFRIPQTSQVILISLVIKADWIASNTDFFPLSDPTRLDRLQEAMAEIGLPGPWRPEVPTSIAKLYQDRFGSPGEEFTPRPSQHAVSEVAMDMAGPGIIVMEAPPGEGKTEGGTASAEILAARFGAGGLHFGLPTQATADSIFSRLMDWVERVPGEDLPIGATMWLGHSKNRMNDAWDRLVTTGSQRNQSCRVSANEWMRSKSKRAHLASIAVSTVDHILLAGLKSWHLMLRHLGLSGKVVIIDEVHAYDKWMSGYLDRVLRWLGEYRTPVIILSATLPPSRRAELVAAYTGQPAPAQVSDNTAYPLVTAVTWDGQVTQAEPELSSRKSKVSLGFIGDDQGKAIEHICAAVEADACVLAIRNTVGRAQDLYRALVSRLGEDRVTLNHSRFMAVDRSRLDNELLDSFGSPKHLADVGGTRPKGHVVVATQVAEQSLDIDFDLLLTDLAPVDLVMQRVGRLHRHERDRPCGYTEPTCLITGVDFPDDGPPSINGGSESIYGASALLRSAHVLVDRPSLNIPEDIAPLVRQAYEGDDTRPGWEDAMVTAADEASAKEAEKASGSRRFQVSQPDGAKPIFGWVDGTADDSLEGKSEVRDTTDTLEVTLMVRDEGGFCRLPDWPDGLRNPGMVIPSDEPIPKWLWKDIEGCALRMPQALSTSGVQEALWGKGSVPEAWEEGVGNQRPVLFLDENLAATVTDAGTGAAFSVSYNPTEGLVHEKL